LCLCYRSRPSRVLPQESVLDWCCSFLYTPPVCLPVVPHGFCSSFSSDVLWEVISVVIALSSTPRRLTIDDRSAQIKYPTMRTPMNTAIVVGAEMAAKTKIITDVTIKPIRVVASQNLLYLIGAAFQRSTFSFLILNTATALMHCSRRKANTVSIEYCSISKFSSSASTTRIVTKMTPG